MQPVREGVIKVTGNVRSNALQGAVYGGLQRGVAQARP